LSHASAPPPTPRTVGVDALDAIATVLQTVEELAEDQSGVVTFRLGDITDTVIFVQSGKICWTASRSLEGRLVPLFAHYVGEDAASRAERALTEFRQSNQKGSPEQKLRESGIDEQQLRCALRQHAIETFATVPADARPSWAAHSHEVFGARCAFSGAELLASAAEWLLPKQAQQAKAELAKMARGVKTALSFERVRGGEVHLLAALQADVVCAREVFEVGRCAVEILDLTSSFCPDERVTCSTTSFGMDVVTWEAEAQIHCLFCPDQAVLAAKLVSVARILKLCDPPGDPRPSGTQRMGG
jgi:hypothetical protein